MNLKSNKKILDSYFKVSETPEYQLNNMIDMILYQINKRMNEEGVTKKQLAEKMGIHASSLSRLLNASSNTSLLTIAKAATALNLKFSTIKFIPSEQSDAQVDEYKSFIKCKTQTWWPETSCSLKNRNVYKFFSPKSIFEAMDYPVKDVFNELSSSTESFNYRFDYLEDSEKGEYDIYSEAVA